MCVSACVHPCACVRVHVCVHVCVCMRASVRTCFVGAQVISFKVNMFCDVHTIANLEYEYFV